MRPLPAEKALHRIALIGLGLIGGSLALAIRRAAPATLLTAYDPALSSAAWARHHGVEAMDQVETAVAQADLVVLASPLATFHDLFEQLAPVLNPTTLICDVASTKTTALQLASAWLDDAIERYVPCHPIAGSERSGAGHARADLFAGRPVILTPDDRVATDALAKVESFWHMLNCKTVRMSASEHDRLFAYLSHAPHLFAFAYMAEAGTLGLSPEQLALAGPGFRDFTRIAGGNPELWADILLDNRAFVGALLERQKKRLDVLGQLLTSADRDELIEVLSDARDLRAGLE
jgi:prephenate dehydrogenase